ncbi:MAG: SIMPL domain-containing protein [Actinobacteria bacterium]|nr:SIMPL domain-containing protein [Actinomycetota bacterium]
MGLKRRWGILAVLGVTALVLSGCTDSTVIGSEEDLPSITARGVGEVTGVPDTVIVVLGVETQASQAADALASNNESSTAVIDELKSAGIANEDIQTSQFSISPVFGEEREASPGLPPPPPGPRGDIVGYTVTNLVTARISTDANAGDIIDAAAEAAGDDIRVQSVRFEIDDKSGLYAEARADAVERAREQAEQLAEAAGVELGDVRSITEQSTGGFPPMPRAEFDQGLGGGVGGPGFEPGSEELTLQVEVVYEISN